MARFQKEQEVWHRTCLRIGMNMQFEHTPRLRVGIVVTENVSLGTVLNILNPFRAANRLSGEDLFDVAFFSLDGQAVTSISGMTIPVAGATADIDRRDILVLASSYDMPSPDKSSVLALLNWHHRHGAMIWAVDQAVLILAESGIVGDQCISAHWEVVTSINERWPGIRVSNSLYSLSRNFATCGGHTAALDMTMAFIYDRFGDELATAVANEMLCSAIRSSEAQFPNDGVFSPWRRNSVLRQAVTLMREHVETPLPISKIADTVGVSTRQLEYLCKRYLSETPMRHYTRIRIQQARRLLIYSHMDITEIAFACGFQSISSFSRSFQRVMRVSPTGYRSRFLRSFERPYVEV